GSGDFASRTPATRTDLLTACGLGCQKYFPAMVRSMFDSPPVQRFGQVDDVRIFETLPHPSIGPMTTLIRRHALNRVRALISDPSASSVAVRRLAWRV